MLVETEDLLHSRVRQDRVAEDHRVSILTPTYLHQPLRQAAEGWGRRLQFPRPVVLAVLVDSQD